MIEKLGRWDKIVGDEGCVLEHMYVWGKCVDVCMYDVWSGSVCDCNESSLCG